MQTRAEEVFGGLTSDLHDVGAPGSPSAAPGFRDVRARGFQARTSVAEVWAWLDAWPAPSEPEVAPLGEAAGRRLAAAVLSPGDAPDVDRAAFDGIAVRAADCDGAATYNPLTLRWCEAQPAVLAPGSACAVAAGAPLPEGADAVASFEAAQPSGTWLEVLAPVAPGTGVMLRGSLAREGDLLLRKGARLRPQDVACLAALGRGEVEVLRRPRVRTFAFDAKSGSDALRPLLSSLLLRDGAEPGLAPAAVDESSLSKALAELGPGEADLVLVAGRSGVGPDDGAASAIHAAGGKLAHHGLALHPGGSAGAGVLACGAPVILLPGEPFACLTAYDLMAARLLRRFAGLGPGLPYPTLTCRLERKIASGIGMTEIVPVTVAEGRARASGAESGLGADGFVVVAENSEGSPAGALASVHLYDAGQVAGAGAGGPVVDAELRS